MAEIVDAAGIAQLVARLGLMDDRTARELMYELDNADASASDLVKLMERKGYITPFQTSKLLKGETDGYILGGYKLLYKISSGTFGRVYRGQDPQGQSVAVKVLRRRWTEDAKRVESFEREGRIGMTLEHPNIVRLLALSKDAPTGQHYIVMEFVEGDNLKKILQIRKTLPVDESLRIMEECAAGLAYASSRGLTHRDVKTSNILLGTDKTAKLVDFGLAEISSAAIGTSNKEEEQADRTVDYAGLERATGVKQGDVRSDIYFLGHVLFEMITGEPLMIPTKDKNARMNKRRFEEAEVTLQKLGEKYKIHPSAMRVIGKAIALEPGHRYQTPAAFHEAIIQARGEISGNLDPNAARKASGPLTVFVVEGNQKLQDAFREKFKKHGFRVLISLDGAQAIKRYQTQPYHALVIDVGTAGPEGVDHYKRLIREAAAMHLDLAAVLIINEDQTRLIHSVKDLPGAIILTRPVTMKQLLNAISTHLPELQEPGGNE